MLENTDKALANVIETINRLSQQMSPDVMTAIQNVAMLDVQGDLISSKIFIAVGSVMLLGGIMMALYGFVDDNGFSVGGTIIGLVALLIIGFSISELYSPLNQAAARDGKIALAAKAVSKIMSSESK